MYKLEGFEFESEQDYKLAKKELEGIIYMKEQTKMDDPDVVLRLYRGLIEKQVFESVVGYAFLYSLREYLETIPYIKSEDLPPIQIAAQEIPVRETPKKEHRRVERTKTERDKDKNSKEVRTPSSSRETAKYRRLFRITFFTLILCVIIIIGMYVVTIVSGRSTTILNYENEIINKYESWESELEEWESELNEREKALDTH